MSPRTGARPRAHLVMVPPDAPAPPARRLARPRPGQGHGAPHVNGSAPPDLLIVHNAASTKVTAEAIGEAAAAVLGPRGLTHRLVTIPPGSEGERVVRRQITRAIREGCARIAAAGGDGTVGMVAQCLARRRPGMPLVSLGIIPAGTTNVLARELGLPLGLSEALAVVADASRAVELDAILAGRRYIFTQVGVGPDALMIRDTRREQQEKLGRLAYILTFLRRAFAFRPRWFTLRLDGVAIRERAWQIVAANVGTVGAPPFTWGPRIDPTDGTLDICVFHVRRKRDFGKLLWRSLTNRHRRDENARFYRVRDRAVMEASPPLLVQGDGEIIGRTPITLRIVPAALRVLVAKPVEGAVPAPPVESASAVAEPQSPVPDTGGSSESGAPASTDGAGSAPAGPAAPAGPEPGVGEQVEQMIAQRSRTWPLQGRFRHPLAALEAYDAAIFLRLNNISFGAGVDRALEWISRFIHYGEGWAVVVLFILFVDLKKGLEAAVVALPALWATMLTVNVVLKRIFRRRRPFLAFVKARVIGARPRDFSVPAGHAAAGFAGALLLGMFLPRWAPLFYLFALAVGFSRIYLGVHYPSDVLMGAFSGTVLAVTYRALIHLLLAGGA